MEHINFPESNMPLMSGGNENTVPMRVMMCTHPGYSKNTLFIAGKFQFEPEEKMAIAELIDRAMTQNNTPITADQLQLIVNALPPLWITAMHSWFPLVLSVDTPEQMGYEKKMMNLPTDN